MPFRPHSPPAPRSQADSRLFLLQRVQPAMTGLIDGSLSTLAPIFAVALATHDPHYAFLAGLATYALLCDHGLGGTSMDAVADRAGVSKATIYRWWSSKELLALEALYESWDMESDAAPATGETTLDDELLALVLPWVRMVADSA